MVLSERQGNLSVRARRKRIRAQPEESGSDIRRDIYTYPEMTPQQLMESLRDLPDGTMVEVHFNDLD